MFVKLKNVIITKFGKYPIWASCEELGRVVHPFDSDMRMPSEYKVDIEAWVHEPASDYGVKIILIGCFWSSENVYERQLSYDSYDCVSNA